MDRPNLQRHGQYEIVCYVTLSFDGLLGVLAQFLDVPGLMKNHRIIDLLEHDIFLHIQVDRFAPDDRFSCSGFRPETIMTLG